jgi:uncharacterized protein (DUF58 family)
MRSSGSSWKVFDRMDNLPSVSTASPYRKDIFDEATVRKLNQLTLVARQVRAGVLKGERRSTRRGSSVEFADYRNYTPGDDLRRLDWNVYARLDRPFIKLFEEEEDLAVYVLVDASRSMDWGEGEWNKSRYAAALAGALGAIALAAGDRLSAIALTSTRHRQQFGPWRGQQGLVRYLLFLEGIAPSGVTDLNAGLREFALSAHRPGLAFLISDLFSPGGFLPGLTQLQSRGYEAVVLHLLHPEEIDPPLSGDLRLVDVETGQVREVSLDGGLRELYRKRVEGWREEIRAACRKHSIRYLGISTGISWDKVVLSEMRKEAIVK